MVITQSFKRENHLLLKVDRSYNVGDTRSDENKDKTKPGKLASRLKIIGSRKSESLCFKWSTLYTYPFT